MHRRTRSRAADGKTNSVALIYFVELRDTYVCSWCEIAQGRLVLLPYTRSGASAPSTLSRRCGDCGTSYCHRDEPYRRREQHRRTQACMTLPGLPRFAQCALSIFLMIRSVQLTALATSDSVLGVERHSCNSSALFKWRATRIPATIASTRLRPSSTAGCYYIRLSFANVIVLLLYCYLYVILLRYG